MQHLGLLDVDSRSPAAALLQRRVIAGSLRADQTAEAEVPAGDRQFVAGVVDDLQEEPGVRTPLVELSRRVQIARAVAVRDDEAAAAPQLPDEVGYAPVVLVV